MRIRFTTSVGGTSYHYMEGQQIDIPDPAPGDFLEFLKRGVCVPVTPAPTETTEAARPKERAVTRGRGTTKGQAPSVPKMLAAGGLAVCIGGGPSLTPAMVDACRGKAIVIAINDAYKLAPWADVLYGADEAWWRWHGGVPSFTGPKYSLQPGAAKWPGVTVLRNTGDRGLEMDPTGLRTGKNGGYQAINLAVHLGATRILLIGYDMQVGPNNKRHWFGDHPIKETSPYHAFILAFSDLVQPLRDLDISVINCTPGSALDCFERGVLEQELAGVPVGA